MISSEGAAGLQGLKHCKSLGKALEHAIEFEHAACGFYRSLEARLSEEVRPLAEELAQAADNQCEHLRELSRDDHLDEHLAHCVERPATCTAFTRYARLPCLPDNALDDDLLEYALNMDRIAFEHYGHLYEVSPDGSLRDLFSHLAKGKLQRIELLERRWADLFSVF